MNWPVTALAVTASLAGCAAPSQPSDGPLPILNDYPVSINATAARGSIQLQPDGCLVFTRSDGAKMLPVFRPGSSIEKLTAQMGDLTTPRSTSIMGLTVLDSVPDEIARFQSNRKCSQTPFVFGNFDSSDALPPKSPTDALTK